MVEQKKERVAIHFSVSDIDIMIAFYSDVLAFKCVKDTHLAGGGRWAAVAKDDNYGIQLHFHEDSGEKKTGHMHTPICIEFSQPDVSQLRKHLESKRISYEIWDCPWACGVYVNDPFGNRLNFSEHF